MNSGLSIINFGDVSSFIKRIGIAAARWFYNSLLARTYLWIFARPAGQAYNDVLLRLALKGRGYNNFTSPVISGEAKFLDLVARADPKLCIDVGANRGRYSEVLLNTTDTVVIAFEPLPLAFADLRLLQERFPERLLVENCGVGSEDGTLSLNYGDLDSEFASFSTEVNRVSYVGSSNVNAMTVPVVKLDSFLKPELSDKFGQIDLLKIDTEGFELEVLLGARVTIERLRPRFIQIEYNWHQLFRGQSLYSLSRLLPGYVAYQMVPYGFGLVRRDVDRPESNIYHYSNFVFVHNEVDIRDF